MQLLLVTSRSHFAVSLPFSPRSSGTLRNEIHICCEALYERYEMSEVKREWHMAFVTRSGRTLFELCSNVMFLQLLDPNHYPRKFNVRACCMAFGQHICSVREPLIDVNTDSVAF